MKVTIFDLNIAASEDRLVLSKTHFISNAIVKYTPPRFRDSIGKFQWSIYGTTRKQEIQGTHGFKHINF